MSLKNTATPLTGGLVEEGEARGSSLKNLQRLKTQRLNVNQWLGKKCKTPVFCFVLCSVFMICYYEQILLKDSRTELFLKENADSPLATLTEAAESTKGWGRRQGRPALVPHAYSPT